MATGLIPMRRVLTILTAIALLAASLAIGALAADLPFWRRALQLPLPVDELYLPVASIGAPSGRDARDASDQAVAQPAIVPPPELEQVIARARDAGSRALLVMHGGATVLARYFGADDDGTLLPA